MDNESTEPASKKLRDVGDDAGDDFDSLEAVFNRIGSRYSHCVLLLMTFSMIFPGMITLAPNFTSAGADFNCSENASVWGNNSELAGCQPMSAEACSVGFSCAGNASRSLACSHFDFDDTEFVATSVTRFRLVCGRSSLAVLATTFYFVGFLFGCTIYGRLADSFGRLKVMLASTLNLSACTIAASQAPTLWLYWLSQALSGAGSGGVLTVMYTFALEAARTRQRHVWGFTLHHGWTIGTLCGAGVAYFERRYDRLLLWYGLSVLLLLPALLPLRESPRWLYSVGRFADADHALRRIARFNGQRLKAPVSAEAVHRRSPASATATAGSADLFRTPGLRRLTLGTWFIFFNVSLAFYGISLGVGQLGGSVFLNQVYCAAVEIPARFLGMAASLRIGRRRSIMAAFSAAGVCLLVTAALFQFPSVAGLQVTMAMVGKFWITVAFDLAWLYSTEVFPTVVRSVGVGSGSTLARAGALASTLISQLGAIWQPLPFLVFATGPLAVVLVALLLPETRNRQLPDTLEEGEAFVLGRTPAARRLIDLPLS